MPPRQRRRAPRRATKNKITLKKVNAKVNKLANMTETKHVDVLKTQTEINFDVNSATALFLPVQGDAHNERVGDVASPFRLTMKIALRNVADEDKSQFVRMMIIQSKQRYTPSTITTSGVTQLFSTADVDDVVNSNLVHDNRSHYVVLHDKTYILSPDGNRGTFINISKKISRHVEFEPGATTTESGQIWMVLTSDVAVGSVGPTAQWASRILYKDA